MNIRKTLKYISFVLLLSIFSCGGSTGNVEETAGINSGTTEVIIDLGKKETMSDGLSLQRAIPFDVNKVTFVVSGPKMETIIKKVNNINPGTNVKVPFAVPSGLNRKFRVFAFDNSDVLLYFGSATANLKGKPLSITIYMSYYQCDRFVAVNIGNNTLNDCSDGSSPCRTITRAISQASAGNAICVIAGIYDISAGESFPLNLGSNFSLVCVGPNKSTIIDGAGSGQNVIAVSAPGASVIGCRIRADNSMNSITDTAGAPVSVDNCIIEPSPGTDNNTGISLVSDSSFVAGSTVRNFSENTFGGEGILISSASPVIGYSQIYRNTVGIRVNNGQPFISSNAIACNDDYNLDVFSPAQINAANNSWNSAPPTVGLAGATCTAGSTDVCYSDGGAGWSPPLLLPFNSPVNCP